MAKGVLGLQIFFLKMPFLAKVIMTSELGTLREVKDSELGLMLCWRNSPEVRANMYTQHEITLDEHLSWWKETKCRNDRKYLMFEKNSLPQGIVGFSVIDRNNSNCAWAFYASPDAAKGAGVCMEFLAIDYAFEKIKMNKLYCEVLAFNIAVIKLHQKFGFLVEGNFRNHHLINNNYVDILRFGLLNVEWQNKRSDMLNRVLSSIRAKR